MLGYFQSNPEKSNLIEVQEQLLLCTLMYRSKKDFFASHITISKSYVFIIKNFFY